MSYAAVLDAYRAAETAVNELAATLGADHPLAVRVGIAADLLRLAADTATLT